MRSGRAAAAASQRARQLAKLQETHRKAREQLGQSTQGRSTRTGINGVKADHHHHYHHDSRTANQLNRLKSARLQPTTTSSSGTTGTEGKTKKHAKQQQRHGGVKSSSLLPRPSGSKRSRSDSALPRGAGNKYLPPHQSRQQVIVTLPQPKLVTPPRTHTYPSSRRRHQQQQQNANNNTVPALLSASAQENLDLVQQGQQVHARRRAPQSPGEENDDDYEVSQREHSRLSSNRGHSKDKSKKRQKRRRASSHYKNRNNQQLSPLSEEFGISDDPTSTEFRSGELEAAPDFRRISQFHVEVSESFSPSEEDNPHLQHHKPSIQLDPRNILICAASFIVIAVIGLGAWLSPVELGGDSNNEEGNGNNNGAVISTLELIQQRGVVKCGMNSYHNQTTTTTTTTSTTHANVMSDDLHGFNIEQCRAMALIALGDATKYEQVWVDMDTRFELLANMTVDIITEGTTFTMGRDVFETNTKTAFSFTTPYFYAGLMIAGNPSYVDCLEAVEGVDVECQGLRICTVDGSMHQEILLDVLNGVTIVPNDNVESMESKIQSGVCNVVAAEPLFLAATQQMFGDSNKEWKMGTKVLSSVPLSHVTRQDDTEWSTLANLAINAFVIAETQSVPQQLALELAVNHGITATSSNNNNNGTGIAFESLLLSLISEYGDYGGYYDTHIEALIPPGFGLNKVYDQYDSTGLLSSYPFGNLNELGPGPVHNGTLDAILTRGYLVCGILPSRGPGFASISSEGSDDWFGLDVEFCKGIAASLFGGDGNKIVFVDLNEEEQPYDALASEEVDVVAGARVTLQAMYKEPTSGQGFSFTTPYYYDNESHDAYAFMTRQDDPQWSDYCFWIVMGVIHAEEKNIAVNNATEMPMVTLFGELLKPMFSDCVGSTGNYGELYNSTLEEYIPRSGPNLLNDGSGPKLFPIPIIS